MVLVTWCWSRGAGHVVLSPGAGHVVLVTWCWSGGAAAFGVDRGRLSHSRWARHKVGGVEGHVGRMGSHGCHMDMDMGHGRSHGGRMGGHMGGRMGGAHSMRETKWAACSAESSVRSAVSGWTKH
eukprot:5774625-Prymnesium_polylepis.1